MGFPPLLIMVFLILFPIGKQWILWRFCLCLGSSLFLRGDGILVLGPLSCNRFSCRSLFQCLVGLSLSLHSCLAFSSLWKIKIPNEVKLFVADSGRVNSLDHIMRKSSFLIGLQCCILCRSVVEDLDHLLWRSWFASLVWYCFFQTFGVCLA